MPILPRNRRSENAILVLEDGSVFTGYSFGAKTKISGEVVFSTSMVGYPEALTDPSYKGQILTLTYPLVGNYGVPSPVEKHSILEFFESDDIKVSGLILHELCLNPHHWSSTRTLDEWLASEGVPGIYGVDTRALTKKLRVEGVMLGVLQTANTFDEISVADLQTEACSIPDPNLRDLAGEVSVKEPITYDVKAPKTVVVVDCGVKNNILRCLLKRHVNVVRVPYDSSSSEVLEHHPQGVLVSNGPGDPKRCSMTIQTVRELVDEGIPIFGICLGVQLLSLALGGDTYKLKYGHRSQNQPAYELATGRCYITTQNHGFAISEESLRGSELEPWFINANDKTMEGVRHKSKPVFAVQWHPEASPGPYDTEFLFDQFLHATR